MAGLRQPEAQKILAVRACTTRKAQRRVVDRICTGIRDGADPAAASCLARVLHNKGIQLAWCFKARQVLQSTLNGLGCGAGTLGCCGVLAASPMLTID
jgi:hypothetical protein